MKKYKRCLRCNCVLRGNNAQDVGYCLTCFAIIHSDMDGVDEEE